MKIQFLLFMLTDISVGGELPENWQQEWPNFLKSEMLQNQHAFFPLVKSHLASAADITTPPTMVIQHR